LIEPLVMLQQIAQQREIMLHLMLRGK